MYENQTSVQISDKLRLLMSRFGTSTALKSFLASLILALEPHAKLFFFVLQLGVFLSQENSSYLSSQRTIFKNVIKVSLNQKKWK